MVEFKYGGFVSELLCDNCENMDVCEYATKCEGKPCQAYKMMEKFV